MSKKRKPKKTANPGAHYAERPWRSIPEMTGKKYRRLQKANKRVVRGDRPLREKNKPQEGNP